MGLLFNTDACYAKVIVLIDERKTVTDKNCASLLDIWNEGNNETYPWLAKKKIMYHQDIARPHIIHFISTTKNNESRVLLFPQWPHSF